jgi:hypothetical protein
MTRSSSHAELNLVGLLMRQVEAVTFERALMLQAAASKLRRYRSMILSSHRPDQSHPWACRQTPDENEP